MTTKNGQGLGRRAEMDSKKELEGPGSAARGTVPKAWRLGGRNGSCRQASVDLEVSLETREIGMEDREYNKNGLPLS